MLVIVIPVLLPDSPTRRGIFPKRIIAIAGILIVQRTELIFLYLALGSSSWGLLTMFTSTAVVSLAATSMIRLSESSL